MAQTQEMKFACPSCRKEFTWKPEIAGKKAKCKCGTVIDIPAESPLPPLPPPDVDPFDNPDYMYDFADDDKPSGGSGTAPPPVPAPPELQTCPNCGGNIPPGGVVCLACGFNVKTGKKHKTEGAAAAKGPGGKVLPYQRGKGMKEEKAPRESGMVRDVWVPTALVAAGLCLSIVDGMVVYEVESAGLATVWALVTTVVNLVLIFIGMLICVKLVGISLGHPLSAMLKIAAIAVVPAPITDLIGHYIGPGGDYVGWSIAMIFYYGMFMYFFDMDFQETMICSSIIWIIRTFLFWMVMAALFSGFMSKFMGDDALDDSPVPGIIQSDDEDEEEE